MLLFLLAASAWAALVNGQPFFLDDTSAYIRGPDFAIVHFLGDRFATTWTQDRTLRAEKIRSTSKNNSTSVQDVPLNSPYDKAVLAGRSVYYGALLYLGHVTSYLWIPVFAQAAVFLYLCYTFTTKCLGLSFPTFFSVTSILLVATPVSFYISFLMPDIFASLLILSTIILAGFWNTLKTRDRILIIAIILYSVLAHISHLLLLFILASVFVCTQYIARRSAVWKATFSQPAFVLFAIFIFGVIGELAFSYTTRLAIGVDPIRPPVVMARLIDDGPGFEFLKTHCGTKSYKICDYVDRLPTTFDYFLWSFDPRKGVYNVVDLPTRMALASEQFSFVVDVVRYDPIGVMAGALKNWSKQLLTVGLEEFFHAPQELEGYKKFLPDYYFNGLSHSNISANPGIRPFADVWFSSIYFLSTVGLILMSAFWPLVKFEKKPDGFPQPQWFYVLSLAVSGVLFNAAICGALATPHMRYQTRISWVPLFVLLIVILKIWRLYAPERTSLKPHVARS